MEESTLTRTPVERPETTSAPEEKTEETSDTGKVEPTPRELVELNRPPFVIDLLEAGEFYNTFGVKDQAKDIDEFVRAEMLRQDLDDTRENYEEVFKSLWRNIEPSSVYTNIEQLAKYARIQSKIVEALEEEEKFKLKDPLKMDLKELERYLRKNVGKY